MKNREIKFRGLNKKGNWRYGFIVFKLDEWLICDTVDIPPCMSEPGGDTRFYSDVVNPESIGQFTGLTDKNGVEIYEGDIVFAKDWKPSKYEIKFIEGAFCGTYTDCIMPTGINHWYDSTGCSIEVVGNIYSTPNLLPPPNIKG